VFFSANFSIAEKYHKEKSRTKTSHKPPDSGNRSTLFTALTALSCDNPVHQSPTLSETGSTNSSGKYLNQTLLELNDVMGRSNFAYSFYVTEHMRQLRLCPFLISEKLRHF